MKFVSKIYDEDLIVELYLSGLSKEETGKRADCSEATVSRILKKLGIPNRKTAKDHLEEKKDEILKKYKDGMGSDSLAAEYNCSPSAMLRFLKRNTEVKRKTEVLDRLNENKQTIIDAYNSGESTYSLARTYDTQDAMIYLFLRDKCGVQMRINNNKTFEEYKDRVKELYDDGLSVNKIAETIDANTKSVNKWLNDIGCDTSRYSDQREVYVRTFAEDIVEKYLNGDGCTVLSQEYDCAEGTISKIIREAGLDSNLHSRQYNVNHRYFENIDSWWKAYWAGWIVTDGANSGYSVRLSITDLEICEKFNECTENETPIRYIKRREEHHQDQYLAAINSKIMCEDLSKMGIIPNKTHHTYFPDIPEHLWSAFLLGVYEGDGTISISQNKNGTYHGYFGFVGNDKLLVRIQQIILDKFHIRMNVYHFPKCPPNIICNRITNREDIITVMDWLYKDAPFYLKRKHDKYILLGGKY